MSVGKGVAEMVLEVLRNTKRFNPDRALTATEITYRIFGEKWEKTIEIGIEKRTMTKLEEKKIVESIVDSESGRKRYRLTISLEEANRIDVDDLFG